MGLRCVEPLKQRSNQQLHMVSSWTVMLCQLVHEETWDRSVPKHAPPHGSVFATV
jgi:hypothetical protein